MDIKRAKQEIKNSVEAYLEKDEFGEYRIPAIRQRPILLMGPPGIGKTQIMEQIARECRVGLVAYTITHHTRQSAVGLPFIRERSYGGRKVSVTEYTMSEIIASVYEKMEQTGVKEGILFLDEINCVSETLAPAMLQFLQGKTFGNQKVPEGWVIVTAGNPPEYNKSVREFDVVTLDRLKKIEVEENFEVWKEYAYRQGVHPAVISYLELRKQYFYRVETTIDGKHFATARGWEDLSQLMQVYDMLQKTVDQDVVYQYIQHRKIAKDFANYLALYEKYKVDYDVGEILNGKWNTAMLQKVKAAPLDEHLSVISLLNGRLYEMFAECFRTEAFMEKLYESLTFYKEHQETMTIKDVWHRVEKELEEQKRREWISREEERTLHRVEEALGDFIKREKGNTGSGQEVFEKVKEWFQEKVKQREAGIATTSKALESVFQFMEDAFGESQEMVVLITELNANYYSAWFIQENGCDLYYRYNKGLLFGERQQSILQEMEEVETLLNTRLKSNTP